MAKKIKAKSEDNPLTLHKATGQWCKKVRGKIIYFGKDLDAALVRWATEKDRLVAGLPVMRHDTRPTIEELGNVYNADCLNRILEGSMTQRTLDEAKKSINRFIEIVGKNVRPDDLRPLDFSNVKAKLFEPVQRTTEIRGGIKGISVERRSPITVAGDVRRIRAFLNWCADSELISPPRWAKKFQAITAKQSRSARSEAGRKLIAPEDILAILEKASSGLKPMILLGINAGMGASDLAAMTLKDLPAMKGEVWIDTYRGKTGAPRRFVLWPETRDAIATWLKNRPEPYKDAKDRVFLTRDGVAWVRENTDAIAKAFGLARKAAGINSGTFYDLRRAFQTIGSQTKEYRACSYVMGHVVEETDMSGRYTVQIPDEQIRTVCNHVRKWLFSK